MPLDFSPCHILVIGDLMLDKYWSGQTTRTSPEAPVIVVDVKDETDRIGGAGNVAINAKSLNANVSIIGITGNDDAGKKIKQLLEEKQIFHYLQEENTLKTITKLRVLSHKQQTIRLDFEDALIDADKRQLTHYFNDALSDTNVVILSDYNKGTLSDPQIFIQEAIKRNIPVFVDPKGQDFSKYKGATLIKPNRHEFELIVGPCSSQRDFIEKGQALINSLNINSLLITLSEDGMLLIEKNGAVGHVASSSTELVDVTGAGDTVIATFAVAKANGFDNLSAMHLANLAAAVAVSKSGTAAVSLTELRNAYMNERPLPLGLTEPEALAKTVKQLKTHGQTIVFTNGCFDIMHAGHIAYLKKAKALGDKLIVAINSDDSIKRLKGNDRPYSPESSRVEVLASLRFVDWVVVFSEDTPVNLLKKLEPSMLVKGGDYQEHEVVGHELVRAYGGQVKVIQHEYLHLSSTAVINKLEHSDASH